jgi:alkylation response protein AidB-like acyl-CoA dehydrogenase
MTSVKEGVLDRLQEIGPVAAADAARAEADGRLGDDLLAHMHEAGVFRLMLPVEDGGRDFTFGECLPVFETLARADGATGWIATIGCTGLGIAGRQMSSDVERSELLSTDGAFVAGGVNPMSLRASVVDGGYRLSGRIGFASGSAHATHFFAGAAVFDGGTLVEAAEGGPLVIGLLLDRGQVTVLDTWHVAGLDATSSCDLMVDDAFVPAARAFHLTGPTHRPNARDPFEMVPLSSRLGGGLAHVCLGIAAHALDELGRIAGEHPSFGTTARVNERADVQIAAAQAHALVDAGRAYLRSVLDETAEAEQDDRLEVGHLARLRLAVVTAASNAAAATDLAFRAAGSGAIYEQHDLARCWRDVHVAQHHVMVSTRHHERIGRVLLGLPPGPGPL